MVKSTIYSVKLYHNGCCSTLKNSFYMNQYKTCTVKKSTISDSLYIDGITTGGDFHRHRFARAKHIISYTDKPICKQELVSLLYIGDTVIEPGSPLINSATLTQMINDDHVNDVLDKV